MSSRPSDTTSQPVRSRERGTAVSQHSTNADILSLPRQQSPSNPSAPDDYDQLQLDQLISTITSGGDTSLETLSLEEVMADAIRDRPLLDISSDHDADGGARAASPLQHIGPRPF